MNWINLDIVPHLDEQSYRFMQISRYVGRLYYPNSFKLLPEPTARSGMYWDTSQVYLMSEY